MDCKRYHSGANEVGIHLDKNNILAVDIVIFKAADSIFFQLEKHAPQAPLVAIEIDNRIETTEFDESHYVYEKTRKLLEWGTEKVIWVFSKTETVRLPGLIKTG